MIRVLIAARSAIARAGLESLLSASPGIQVVTGPTEADVVLIEMESADEELPVGPQAAPVIVLAPDPQAAWVSEALRSGMRAVLPRDLSAAELVAAVEAAAAGLVVLDPQQVDQLLPVTPQENPPVMPQSEALTPREIEVLRMLAEGLGNKEIGWRLGISEHTVKFHVASVMGKLNAGSRTEAVTLGIRRGLIML